MHGMGVPAQFCRTAGYFLHGVIADTKLRISEFYSIGKGIEYFDNLAIMQQDLLAGILTQQIAQIAFKGCVILFHLASFWCCLGHGGYP